MSLNSKQTKSLASRLFRKLLKDEAGQSTTEYILILAVVVMIAVRFKGLFNEMMGNALGKLQTNMGEAIDSN